MESPDDFSFVFTTHLNTSPNSNSVLIVGEAFKSLNLCPSIKYQIKFYCAVIMCLRGNKSSIGTLYHSLSTKHLLGNNWNSCLQSNGLEVCSWEKPLVPKLKEISVTKIAKKFKISLELFNILHLLRFLKVLITCA